MKLIFLETYYKEMIPRFRPFSNIIQTVMKRMLKRFVEFNQRPDLQELKSKVT